MKSLLQIGLLSLAVVSVMVVSVISTAQVAADSARSVAPGVINKEPGNIDEGAPRAIDDPTQIDPKDIPDHIDDPTQRSPGLIK